MALQIPIISSFDDKGISSAIKEFKQLENNTDRVGFVAKKAAQTAAVAFAGLAVAGAGVAAVLGKAAQAAAADQAGQTQLASSIRASTDATDAQIASLEDFVDETQRATGVADDNLRPALGRLVRATGDITKAQDLLNLSLDLSAATGKEVETVANALGKAQEGAFGPISKLGLGYEAAELKAMGFQEVQKLLEERFAGSATAKANTYEGVIARLGITFGELQEQIGYMVLPMIEELGQAALRVSDAFGKKGWAGGINQLRTELVGLGTDSAGVQNAFATVYNGFASIYNGIVGAITPLLAIWKFFTKGDLSYKAQLMPTFEELMRSNPIDTSSSEIRRARGFESFNLPTSTVSPGVASAPSVSARSAEPPMTPYTNIGATGTGLMESGVPNIAINIDAGLISNPITIGQDIIDAILAAQRANGTVFAAA
jgi:hypothetical protein